MSDSQLLPADLLPPRLEGDMVFAIVVDNQVCNPPALIPGFRIWPAKPAARNIESLFTDSL